MVPCPIVLGLTVCEKVVIEEGTRNLTLVNCFTKLFADVFPTPPRQFSLCAAFTDGLGEGTIDGVITRLETDKGIYRFRAAVRFASRTAEVRVIYNIMKCTFPTAGKHEICLLIDGVLFANRTLRVLQKQG